MDTDITIGFIGILAGLGGTLGGTWLGAYLNKQSALHTALQLAELDKHKYAHDRLWDARKDAYTKIIATVRAAARLSEAVDDGYNNGELHPEEYHSSGVMTKETGALWEKWREAKAEFEQSRLLLSDNFVAAFEKLEHSLDAIDDEDIPPIIYANYREVFATAVDPILAVAKNEIAPQLPAKIG